ncbi:MAG: T9SS type A sorting domain-containing protein [Bacteroidia bacterium]
MKQLLLLIFCGIFSSAFAQSYTPMVVEGKYWDVYFYNHSQPLSFGSYHRYTFGPDTILNGKVYKNLMEARPIAFPNGLWHPKYVVFSQDFGWTHEFFREDTTTKQVFHLRGEEDELLYDFSLAVGDTTPCGDIISVIDTVILANGEQRTSYYCWGNESNPLCIEGIGSEYGPQYLYQAIGAGWNLECHGTIGGPPLWGYNCTNHFVSNEQEIEAVFSISPNPVLGKTARITSSKLLDRVQLYDCAGRLVLDEKLEGDGLVDVGGFPSGLYYVKAIGLRGEMYQMEKLVVM